MEYIVILLVSLLVIVFSYKLFKSKKNKDDNNYSLIELLKMGYPNFKVVKTFEYIHILIPVRFNKIDVERQIEVLRILRPELFKDFKINVKYSKDSINGFLSQNPPTNDRGYTSNELQDMISKLPLNFNRKFFEEALMGNTCALNEDGEILHYPIDVFYALIAGLENEKSLYFD